MLGRNSTLPSGGQTMEAALYSSIRIGSRAQLREVPSDVLVRPGELLGAPPRQGASVQVQAQRGRSVSVHADALKAPCAGGP